MNRKIVMKRLLPLLLSFCLIVSLSAPSYAAESNADTAADALYDLGLFRGIGVYPDGTPNFDLDRRITREEAITMLVRLLGKEGDALRGNWNSPFLDLSDWSIPYVNYAYEMGLTLGTGETTFGGSEPITASQYLTFVLRALGYDTATDFQWDAAWELSDEIGVTNGTYTAKNNQKFTRGDAAIVSYDALSVPLKNTITPLIDTLPVPESRPENIIYTMDTTGALPADTGIKKLTRSQLAALSGLTPEEAAPSVTTLADAYAWLSQEGYSTYGMSINAGEIANSTLGTKLSWAELSTVLNVLLEDDYDEVGTILIVAQPSEPDWKCSYICFSYVKVNDWYYVTDPIDHLENTGEPVYRAHTIRTNSLYGVKDALQEINGSMTNLVTIAAYPLYLHALVPELQLEPMQATFPDIDGIRYLYQADQTAHDAYLAEQAKLAAEEAKKWAEQAKNILVSDYQLPDAIAQQTLSYETAAALVDAEPKAIRDAVKSVADALQYLIASHFGYQAPEGNTPRYDGWGFDAPGEDQLKQNYGCCSGGTANAVSYLLQGDYEKVGTLRWIGGGNHTISWVYTEGKYYVFDFTLYCDGGEYQNKDIPVIVLDRLEDYYDALSDVYLKNMEKSEIKIIVAFESDAAMYPSQWDDPPAFAGITFPTEAEGKITVIYQADEAAGVHYKELNSEIPGWNI